MAGTPPREGSVDAPTRHSIDWKNPAFYDETPLLEEMERVFDVCHGCRRCFRLCNAFPLLFDAIDESDTMEVDGLAREVYWEVAEHCYLCDLCYLTKCPYVPPHEFNIDFPHLMLRAKAQAFKAGKPRMRDKVLSATETVGAIAGIPVVAQAVNAINSTRAGRALLESTLGVARDAPVPAYHSRTMRARAKPRSPDALPAEAVGPTRGRVALFGTCYGNRNEPDLGLDLIRIFEHNGIAVRLTPKERCCGMPKLELGDLDAVEKLKNENVPMLARLVDEGWDIVAPIPSCVLMFKQELPLLFPHDPLVAKVKAAMFDPFEYLMLRHRGGKLRTDFSRSLGNVSYHVACHMAVQNIGLKTRDVLALVPDTKVDAIERCSGHDGTYGVKKEYRDVSMKIARPVIRKVADANPDHYTSDCPMAGQQIASGLEGDKRPTHPLRLLAIAYGLVPDAG
jgi:glycerol-3-phosphate dehydrogenase subunit C